MHSVGSTTKMSALNGARVGGCVCYTPMYAIVIIWLFCEDQHALVAHVL